MSLHIRILGYSIISVTALVGCIKSQVTPFDPTPVMDRRTPTDRIRFYETQPPRCSYRELGRVSVRSSWFGSWNKVVKTVREKAHDMGGDAVISIREASRINGAVISPNQISTTESHSLGGKVIRFINPACRD